MVRVIRTGKIKMKKTVFFLIILCFSFSTYAYNMSDTSLRGTRSYWQGQDYEMSSKLFHIVLQKNYSDHEKSYAYLYLGMIALRQNNIEQAINYFNKSEKLYSTPYPNRIMYDFFTKQKKEKQALYYLGQMIKWYKNRLMLLLANQFDISQLFFQNTRSCLDGTTDAYKKYWAMYDETQEIRLRWLTHLQYCLDGIDFCKKQMRNLDNKDIFLNPIENPPDRTPKYQKIIKLPIHKQTILFKSREWSGDFKCSWCFWQKTDKNVEWIISITLKQICDGALYNASTISFQGLIRDEKCFIKGADGKYFESDLLQYANKSLDLIWFYKERYFSWTSIGDEKVYSLKVNLSL